MPVCIYCKESKLLTEFSDEHVFSRAFCGQGANWTLPALVCEDCNGIFSACESHWAHSAVEGMMRNFSGPLGRNENEGRRSQPIEVPELYLMQRGDALAYDAGFAYPNTSFMRPQIVEWPPGHVSVTSDVEAFRELNRQLDAMIKAKEIFVTRPAPKDAEYKYEVTRITLEQEFTTGGTAASGKAMGIWLRTLPFGHTIESQNLGETHRVTRRLVLDDRDRMYARAASPSDVTAFLNYLLSTHGSPAERRSVSAKDQEYKISMTVVKPKVFRCVLKTGFNLLTHVKGFDFAMRPEFDEVCAQLIGMGRDVDDPIMARCWFLGEGPDGAADNSGFAAPRGPDTHDMILDVRGRKVRFRLRVYGSLAYVGYLGDVPPEMATEIGTIRAEVAFMGDGIRLI